MARISAPRAVSASFFGGSDADAYAFDQLLADRLPRSGPARRFLDYLPGAILLSITVPGALHTGVEGMIGLGACLLVFMRTKSMLLTMAGVCLLRLIL